jgi:hypothetical protein
VSTRAHGHKGVVLVQARRTGMLPTDKSTVNTCPVQIQKYSQECVSTASTARQRSAPHKACGQRQALMHHPCDSAASKHISAPVYVWRSPLYGAVGELLWRWVVPPHLLQVVHGAG